VILAAVHAALPGQIRALHLDDLDLAKRRIIIAGNSRPLDDLTTHALLDWLAYRRERWPGTTNPYLLVSTTSALGHASVSHTWILNLRSLSGTLERLRHWQPARGSYNRPRSTPTASRRSLHRQVRAVRHPVSNTH
jgi:hypothetical protein